MDADKRILRLKGLAVWGILLGTDETRREIAKLMPKIIEAEKKLKGEGSDK